MAMEILQTVEVVTICISGANFNVGQQCDRMQSSVPFDFAICLAVAGKV